ncbi:MAG: aminotransferase class I/II-fold pyridoxal phosphate-dependent enzyme [Candidatus Zixiibacteriota bacterium]|nr:MAG: aminotransferase class I/II-fold pyridoxal phosphate-dependent enzyme [candidate division Zixibacteria bacterium]
MTITKRVSLNLNVRGLKPSATLAINDRSRELQRQGRKIYRLGLGQSPFPVPVAVVETLRHHAPEKDYLPAQGLRDLREAVAAYHRRKDGVEARPQDVLIGPGSKELMFLLQLAFYGELIAPTPCWVSYVPQAAILGRKVSLIPTAETDGYRVTAEQLERHCHGENDEYRPRILVLNYPSNPVGATHDEGELRDLAAVARKYEVIVLSDEIYGELHHQGRHVSLARFYPEGTIISSGLSKWCGAGGWRLGTFTFPKDLDWLLEAMATLASETYTSVSAPIQHAAVTAFRGGAWLERYLWHARRILAAVGGRCVELIRQADVRVTAPAGAFYLFPNFAPLADRLARRGITDSVTLAERLLADTGVAVLPGVEFQRPPEELTMRMAYVDFDGAGILAASETTPLDQPLPDGFVECYGHTVLEAVRLMLAWAAQ